MTYTPCYLDTTSSTSTQSHLTQGTESTINSDLNFTSTNILGTTQVTVNQSAPQGKILHHTTQTLVQLCSFHLPWFHVICHRNLAEWNCHYSTSSSVGVCFLDCVGDGNNILSLSYHEKEVRFSTLMVNVMLFDYAFLCNHIHLNIGSKEHSLFNKSIIAKSPVVLLISRHIIQLLLIKSIVKTLYLRTDLRILLRGCQWGAQSLKSVSNWIMDT